MDRIDRHRERAGGARAAALVLLSSVVLSAGASPAFAKRGFQGVSVAEIPGERLFDIGVADADADGLLDIFTTNHKFHSSLLHNEGDGNFSDVTGATGLSPSPDFPGYEKLRRPDMTREGIYLYATDSKEEKLPGQIHFRAVGVEATGSISFGSDSAVVKRSVKTNVDQSRTGTGQPIVYFRLQPGGVLDIQPSHLDLPAQLDFADPPPPGILPPLIGPPPPAPPPVFVGTDGVSAPLEFALNLRDRHGYLFADLAGDGATDIFAVSGGLGGVIKLPGFRGKVQDELLVKGGSRFVDEAGGSGLSKDTCRGRQVTAVDIDGDRQLDLFEGCEGQPPNVYLQTSRGQFEPIDPPRSIATTYRWLTLGRGSEPSLLAAERRGTRIYGYREGKWRVRQTVRDDARHGAVVQYALSDLDNDGDLDALAVSRTGNTLLENQRGRLRRVPLKRTGIPGASVAASFVDYDNDGLTDLHLIPQGLFHAVRPGRFRKTGQLSTRAVGAGIASWFDFENDGLRDMVMTTGNAEFARRMKVERHRNLGPGGHWLEVDLVGQDGNREAIGARVAVLAGNRRLYGWVGQSDDSHHSQGHYRMYFGLGTHAQVGGLVVHWPDGAKSRFDAFPADRVIKINHP